MVPFKPGSTPQPGDLGEQKGDVDLGKYEEPEESTVALNYKQLNYKIINVSTLLFPTSICSFR